MSAFDQPYHHAQWADHTSQHRDHRQTSSSNTGEHCNPPERPPKTWDLAYNI